MSKGSGPRKVIVGTSMYAMWGEHPGLDRRLEELGGLVEEMAQQANANYERGLDIAALPEVAVTGERRPGDEGGFPLQGQVQDYFADLARRYHCYVVVPLYMKEPARDGAPEETSNAAALVDRSGEVLGVYRKVHLVSGDGDDILEGGCRPGKSFPVFECDFGKVGIQICYDMAYDDGWQTLGRKGAELVIWTTQSPGQIKAAFRAMTNSYYILTSTWRNNASLFDPSGHMVQSITKPEQRVFVEEIDLEYVLLGWQPKLRNGTALREKYGDRVDFRYSEAEDGGIFWSNDPETPIQQMVRDLGLTVAGEHERKDRILQDRARGGPPSLE